MYGDYWVDRPPVIVMLFQLADALGGAVGLRVLGMVSVGGSVLLAALVPWTLAGSTSPGTRRRASLLTAITTAALLATPLFGAMEVDGELLAVPWVLAGSVLLLGARRAESPVRRALLVMLAGLVGSVAWMTKQNVIDVYVLGAALSASSLLRDRRRFRGTLLDLAALGGGLTAGVAAALLAAVQHGTSLTALWWAVVTFRFRASDVIAGFSSGATPQRFWLMLGAFVLSAAPAVIWHAAVSLRGRTLRAYDQRDPAWPVFAVLAWEAVAVLGGGSYWLHYLIGLVPGIALLVATATSPSTAPPQHRTSLVWAIAAATASTLVAVPVTAAHQPSVRSDDVAVAGYLRAHRSPGDTTVVAYGHPDILEEAGLSSRYDNLWSLPVRVRDPDLDHLRHVLTADQPRWLVTSRGSLSSWGLDATEAQRVVRRDYLTVLTVEKWSVLERRVAT